MADMEKEGEAILEKRGFKILEKRLSSPVITLVSGKSHMAESTADFLAEKERKKYLVHLHGGSISADLNDPALRRKLIENEVVYQPDGLILVDLVDKSLQEISFEFPKTRYSFIEKFFRIIQIAFVMAVVLGIIWLMAYLKLF